MQPKSPCFLKLGNYIIDFSFSSIYNNVMNQKQTKQYNLIENIFKVPFGSALAPKLFGELAAINFEISADMWEYVLSQNSNALSNTQNAVLMAEEILDIFTKQSFQKTNNYVCDSLPLIKLIFGQSSVAGTGSTLNLVANIVLANKVEIAETMLSSLRNNSNIDFNEIMKNVVEKVFENYCAKNAVKKPELNRKQKTLLLGFIDKMRGPNKALLQQRIKEL